ncbi:hypothetical protein TL16_g10989 [Triparma laevis f. inornata]|uniref:Uncharacterized protein n=1 Tax=Triparma laevis f. inornata TaxID=1714386 RepID=A0A9W7EQI7_9STRA|nr:hypothetical protein TL16_g10989 [Triparma laevis f. inornata]
MEVQAVCAIVEAAVGDQISADRRRDLRRAASEASRVRAPWCRVATETTLKYYNSSISAKQRIISLSLRSSQFLTWKILYSKDRSL